LEALGFQDVPAIKRAKRKFASDQR
jgi:hypothetical protein